jgi:hypothetical protein
VAVGAIAIIVVFMIVLTCMGVVIMESNRYSGNVKYANDAAAAKARESLAVVQASSTLVNVTNEGSTPVVVIGFYRVNPADNNPNYVPLSNPVTVPLLSSASITLPQATPENWKVGVVTSLGNVFWEEQPVQGGATQTVPPGQPVYVTFIVQGMGSDASGTVLTVDGSAYTYSQLPKTFQWVSGSTHSFSWSSPVSGSSGVRYVWASTSGLSTKQSDSSFTVNSNGYVVATYTTQYSLTVQASPSSGGATNPSPGTYWYDAGTQVQISASPASGYAFDQWVGSGSGSYTGTSASATVTMNAPITETAYFFTFSISASPNSGTVPVGGSTSATVTVTYQGGYNAKAISFSASGLPSGASASFSPSSVTISPSSTTASSTMTITTSSTTPTGTYTITVTGAGGGVSKSATYTLTIQNTVTVTFSASGLSSDASGVVLVVDNVNYYYSDLPKTFTWVVGTTHNFEWKTPVASSASGKQYAWTSTSGLTNARSGTITASTSGSITATYKTQYYLTMQVSPSGAGSVSPSSGWYDAGSSVSISATANSGYAFTSWTGSGSGSYTGTANPASITMNGPITETANFIPWLTGWSYRRPITISSAQSLSNYQILVQVDTASLVSAGKMRSDGGDIRFTDSDGATLLSYWIEPGTVNTASTKIWVKVPSIPAGTKTIYMYYGNPSATSQSNSAAVFGKSISSRFTAGDCDAYYDAFILSSREWVSGGTNLGISGDDNYGYRTMPYTITIYGTSVNTIALSTNGLLRWDGAGDSRFSNYLDTSSKILTAHWDDLYISTSYRSDAGIYEITGTDANLGQYAAYRWATTYYSSTSTPADFEIILYRNGYIQFNVYQLWSSATPTEYICRGDGSNYIDLTSRWPYMESILFVPRAVPEPTVTVGSEETPSSLKLYEYYNIGDDSYVSAWGVQWFAQSFTVGSYPHTVAQVKLMLWRTGSPGTVIVSIRATDANGYPTGSDLTAGTLDGNSLTTSSSGAWYTVTFSQEITLSANTKYAIVVRAPSATSGNYVNWRLDSTSPTYAGGTYMVSGDGGASWSAPYNYDFMFEVWGH